MFALNYFIGKLKWELRNLLYPYKSKQGMMSDEKMMAQCFFDLFNNLNQAIIKCKME